jgi:hypothetical protein
VLPDDAAPDPTGRGVDHQLGAREDGLGRVEVSEHQTGHAGRDLRTEELGVEWRAVPEKLGGDGRPGRIVVGAVQLDAVQARP